MNAAPKEQLRLLDLQALDAALDQLEHRRRSLPEHADAERLSTRLNQLRSEIITAETEDGDIGREQVKAEGDVEQVVTRSTRDQQRLDAGQVGSPRELENLQSEITSLAKRRSDLEDTVLEIMERREAVQQRLENAIAERDKLTLELGDVEVRRGGGLADINAQVEGARAERVTVAGEISAELLSLYEKIRAQQGGVGAAALHRGQCQGCHLSLDTASLNELRKAAPDLVVRCEECRRILIRTPDSGL